MSTRIPTAALLFLLSMAPAIAQDEEGAPRYISDSITLALREEPSNDATVLTTVSSGDQVSFLRTLGPESFSRIRTENGTVGWVPSRYVVPEPPAGIALSTARADLELANSRIAELEASLSEAQAQLQKAGPALEMAAEIDQLRAQIATKEQNLDAMMQQYGAERARRSTMIVSAMLMAGGVLLGLILPMFGGRKRRRYSDL